MDYTDVKSPQWANSEKTRVDCLVKFDAFDDYLPFTADPNDNTEWGPQIFEECSSGKWGDVGNYIEPVVDPVVIAEGTKRQLLKEAAEKIAVLQDAVELNMATEDEKFQLIEWKKYRVLLTRIKPEDAPDKWPVKPA